MDLNRFECFLMGVNRFEWDFYELEWDLTDF